MPTSSTINELCPARAEALTLAFRMKETSPKPRDIQQVPSAQMLQRSKSSYDPFAEAATANNLEQSKNDSTKQSVTSSTRSHRRIFPNQSLKPTHGVPIRSLLVQLHPIPGLFQTALSLPYQTATILYLSIQNPNQTRHSNFPIRVPTSIYFGTYDECTSPSPPRRRSPRHFPRTCKRSGKTLTSLFLAAPV